MESVDLECHNKEKEVFDLQLCSTRDHPCSFGIVNMWLEAKLSTRKIPPSTSTTTGSSKRDSIFFSFKPSTTTTRPSSLLYLGQRPVPFTFNGGSISRA